MRRVSSPTRTPLSLDITYGLMAGLTSDYAGPFTYTGASAAAPGVIWRTGTGEYQFWWDVPGQGTLPGIYVANWSAQYGPLGDMFMAVENFPVIAGGPFVPVPSGDVGFWTGSLTYQPSWAASPFVISFGATDSNGITWMWQGITGWDSPPTAGTGVIQRSADHGGWPAPQFYGPRIITLTVMASAPSQALRDYARALLEQVVPPGGTAGDLAVLQYNEPVPKTALVRRNSGAQITETYPTLSDVVFSIPLVAPDPRKYAVPPQSAGLVIPAPSSNPLTLPFSLPVSFPGNIPPSSTAVTAYNTGTFETRPTLTVTGPITSAGGGERGDGADDQLHGADFGGDGPAGAGHRQPASEPQRRIPAGGRVECLVCAPAGSDADLPGRDHDRRGRADRRLLASLCLGFRGHGWLRPYRVAFRPGWMCPQWTHSPLSARMT